MKARLLSALAIVSALTVIIAVAIGGVASATSSQPAGAQGTPAPGAPGSESYFDLARKDCVGTARNTSSRVWFTVADGVLSDTYWPNVDATNVHTLQYLVTDGSSVHRPSDPGHDLQGGPRSDRHELHRGGHAR